MLGSKMVVRVVPPPVLTIRLKGVTDTKFLMPVTLWLSLAQGFFADDRIATCSATVTVTFAADARTPTQLHPLASRNNTKSSIRNFWMDG